MSLLDAVSLVLIGAFPFFLVAVIASIWYLFRIYRRSRPPRSWLFRTLIRADAVQAAAGSLLAYLAIRSLGLALHGFTLPGLPPGWNTIAIAFIAYGLLSPPIVQAWAVYRVRRGSSSDETPVGKTVE